MTHFPKQLVLNAMFLLPVDRIGFQRRENENINTPYVTVRYPTAKSRKSHPMGFRAPGRFAPSELNETRYYELADQILEHARKYMTTTSLASYFLRVMKREEPKHVLIVGHKIYEYMQSALLHGLTELGVRVTVAAPCDNPEYYRMKCPPPDGNATSSVHPEPD